MRPFPWELRVALGLLSDDLPTHCTHSRVQLGAPGNGPMETRAGTQLPAGGRRGDSSHRRSPVSTFDNSWSEVMRVAVVANSPSPVPCNARGDCSSQPLVL